MIEIAVGGAKWQNAPGTVKHFATEGLGLELSSLGYALSEPGSRTADFFLALNHFDEDFNSSDSVKQKSRRILVVWEPQIVVPLNFSKRIIRKYGKVFSFNAGLRRSTNDFVYLKWPQQPWTPDSRAVSNSGRLPNTAVMLNTNKVSPLPGALYGLRRRLVRQFRLEELPLNLGGAGWALGPLEILRLNFNATIWAILNRRLPVPWEFALPVKIEGSIKYEGLVDDKQDYLSRSEFALVIENTRDYVSEKLFDAIKAGCIPLYAGPPLALFGIPSDVAIELGNKPAEFTRAVMNIRESDKRKIILAGRKWLELQSTCDEWLADNIFEQLAADIHRYVRQQIAIEEA